MTDQKKAEAVDTTNPATAEAVKGETAATEGEVSEEQLDGVAGGGITVGGTTSSYTTFSGNISGNI